MLRASDENGRAYVEVVPAPATLPWANYDEIEDPEKVVEIAITIGADLDEVIRYELENQNRERWLEALDRGARRCRKRWSSSRHERPRHVRQGPPDRATIDVIWSRRTSRTSSSTLTGGSRERSCSIVPEEDFPMLRQGYVCAQCIEELDVAFPEHCPVCNFPMRERQTEYIAKAYVGNVKTGPSTTLEEEQLIMQEMREREARDWGSGRRVRARSDLAVARGGRSSRRSLPSGGDHPLDRVPARRSEHVSRRHDLPGEYGDIDRACARALRRRRLRPSPHWWRPDGVHAVLPGLEGRPGSHDADRGGRPRRMDEGIENAHSLIATLDGESDAAVAAEQAARIAGDAAVQASVNAHVADAVDAHTAESISVGPTNPVGADDVDEAIRDLYASIVGGGMPSTIIDAKGDLIVGADDDLPTKLAVGEDGQALIADSAEPFGLKWGEVASDDVIPKSIVEAKGDLLVGAADDMIDRLALGTNGHVLTADSTVADGLKWAPAAGGGGGGVDYKGAYNAGTAYVQGDVVLYNGVQYVAVNPGTGQTPPAVPGIGSLAVIGMGTTLPASPFDGQEYVLVDSLTAPTYQWRFRYCAGITDAYKWVFVGGSRLYHYIGTNETTTTVGSAVDLTTDGPKFTAPRAGIYFIEGMVTVFHSAVSGNCLWFFNAPGGGLVNPYFQFTSAVAGQSSSLYGSSIGPLAAGDIRKIRYQIAGAGTGNFSQRQIWVTPQRVS